jgi:hypothetical protein
VLISADCSNDVSVLERSPLPPLPVFAAYQGLRFQIQAARTKMPIRFLREIYIVQSSGSVVSIHTNYIYCLPAKKKLYLLSDRLVIITPTAWCHDFVEDFSLLHVSPLLSSAISTIINNLNCVFFQFDQSSILETAFRKEEDHRGGITHYRIPRTCSTIALFPTLDQQSDVRSNLK